MDKEKYAGFFKSGEVAAAAAKADNAESDEEEGEENPEKELHNLQGELAESPSTALKFKSAPLDPSPYSKMISVSLTFKKLV